MGKRNHVGNIYPQEKGKPKSRCRTWRLYLKPEYNVEEDRYITPTKTFHGTYSEAELAIEEFAEQVAKGKYQKKRTPKKEVISFEELANQFVEACTAPGDHHRSGRTIDKYKDHIKTLNIHIAKARVDRISVSVLKKTFKKIADGGTPSGKKPSNTYINMIHRTASTIFKYAIELKLIKENPCDGIKPPQPDTKERKALSDEQIDSLLEKLDGTSPGSFVCAVSVSSGMRRGEVCGLSWEDLDFEAKEIHIRHSYTDNKELKETKTKAGNRVIPMMPDLEKLLLEHKDFFEKRGYKTYGNNPVVVNYNGERMLPHGATTWWMRNRDKLGASGFSLHELRHSYISMLARRNVNIKMLQVIAGHSKFETTMNIYAHVTTDELRKAIENAS